ncbi:MAG: thiol:disulfide oxidoreductase [Rubritepida sp.]|nr:thiol:disulfide oxidoreductase [Rubritepida sp.]
MPAPLRVQTWPTPNGHTARILLEKPGLPYEVVPVGAGGAEGLGGERPALFASPAAMIHLVSGKGRENRFGASQFEAR